MSEGHADDVKRDLPRASQIYRDIILTWGNFLKIKMQVPTLYTRNLDSVILKWFHDTYIGKKSTHD